MKKTIAAIVIIFIIISVIGGTTIYLSQTNMNSNSVITEPPESKKIDIYINQTSFKYISYGDPTSVDNSNIGNTVIKLTIWFYADGVDQLSTKDFQFTDIMGNPFKVINSFSDQIKRGELYNYSLCIEGRIDPNYRVTLNSTATYAVPNGNSWVWVPLEPNIFFKNSVSPNPTPYPYDVQITYGYPYYEFLNSNSDTTRKVYFKVHLSSDSPNPKIQLEKFYLVYNGQQLDSNVVNNTSSGVALPWGGKYDFSGYNYNSAVFQVSFSFNDPINVNYGNSLKLGYGDAIKIEWIHVDFWL
ncbi:MAG: hypothetical protein NWE96_00905 [Candidatus Bathyarchaeota archaeon]|nr:hypothetical protein [Candidatus Bathyarchaeota archaeon]